MDWVFDIANGNLRISGKPKEGESHHHNLDLGHKKRRRYLKSE